MKIPEKGISQDELFRRMEEYRGDDVNWRSGRTWGYVYDAGAEVEKVAKKAYMSFLSENALDFTVFPSVLRLENEVIAMARSHLRGGDDVVGNFTSGGTESILLAVKTARDYSLAKRPDLAEPEMVLPITGHASFQKAGHYFGVKVVLVPVDPVTFKVDIDAVRAAISPNTILLVGSAPSYAHGVIDPIAELGQLALENDLLLHVDACIGGFLLPYFARLGSKVPDFDFSVPGVTSMSMDLHKYGYAAKGASTVLYHDAELRKHQMFASAQWTGYTMVNMTVQSSKTAGPLAAAWTVLNFIGNDGYLKLADQLRDASARILEGINSIDELRVLGRPEMSLIAFTSDTVNVFHIIDEMNLRGWYIQPQLAFGSSPANIHLSVNPSNVPLVEELISDLRECVELAKAIPTSALPGQIKAAFSTMSPSDLSQDTFNQMLAMAGVQGTELPERMAEINGILDALPIELSERLLTEFVNQMFQYQGE